jgi:glycosyltransferase involved in cell wall biosynthesis
MYKSKTISVVVPCYNEQEGLDKILRSKPPFIDEVIIVDNNSTDSTVDIAKKYGATIVHEKRKGYGQCYLTGLSKVRTDIVVTLDGDNTYPMAEIEKLLLYMENERCDFVSGCRYPLADKKAQPVIIQFANRSISWIIRALFKINLKDSQSGMMAFKRGLLNKIDMHNTGMGFSQELKIKAFLRRDVCCSEAHICYGMRTGRVKFNRMVDSIKNLYSTICLWEELRWRKATRFHRKDGTKEKSTRC